MLMLSYGGDESLCFRAHQIISNWMLKTDQPTEMNARVVEMETGSKADCLVQLASQIFVEGEIIAN